MARPIPFADRRLGEEAVRRGHVAAVVMEAAAREWTGLEGEEGFPSYLVRRGVLAREQVDLLAAEVAKEGEPGAPGATGPGEAAEKSPHPSEVVKGYRILERLGRGGMGSVYRAEQIGMGRTVALKILRRPLGEVEEHVERLRREARLVGSLDHPNIVRGLDVGSHGPYHYFAMEFVEGESLREVLKKRGVLPEAEVLRILEEVCQALDHAHSRGIVHRDVKPGNVILTTAGTPKLTDYGLAKGPSDFTLTQSGVTIGTPQYISPEQAHDPSSVDIQTDVYSLGATAYHMLTGVPPHTSETLAGLLTKVLYEKPRSARQVNPKVSEGASFLVEKMMAKQKRHRYRTPREILRDLRSLAAGKSIVPRNWAGDFEVHEARRKNRVVVGALAAVVVLATGLVWALQVRSDRQARRARDASAKTALDAILVVDRPRTRDEWQRRLGLLEDFRQREEFRGTPAWSQAADAEKEAHRFIARWEQANEVSLEAGLSQRAGRHRVAVAVLEEGIARFERVVQDAGPEGRDPLEHLRRSSQEARDAAFRAARDAARDALDDAGRLPPLEGTAARTQDNLEKRRAEIFERILDPEDLAPVEALDRAIGALREARGRIGDALLGSSWGEFRRRKLEEGDFRALEEELGRVRARAEGDAVLRDLLGKVPGPAAEDLGRFADWEMRKVLAANDAALRQVLAAAGAAADQGDFDAALAALDPARDRAVEELRPEVEKVRGEVAARRDAVSQEASRALRAFWEALLRDLSRRDLPGAAKRVEDARAAAPGAGPGARAAFDAAAFLLGVLEDQAFGKVRDLIAAGGEFPLGLRFEEGSRQPYPRVANVRLRESDTGPVVVFDEVDGPRNLEGSLHRLSHDQLLAASGLGAPGLKNHQALARAALVVMDGEGRSRQELEEALSLLRRSRDALPPAEPAVAALIEACGALVEAKIRAEENLETVAAETLERALKAIQDDDPVTALRHLDLLWTGTLSGTRYAREEQRRRYVRDLREQADKRTREKRTAALYPGAKVTEVPRGNEPDPLTLVEWDFDSEEQMPGFLPPERDHRVLYRVVFDEGANGSSRSGRLAFLAGDEEHGLPLSPLTIPCVFFTKRPIHCSFRCRFEAPIFLQVSIAGNHVGVLTDDGRRTGGRGVFAWHNDDWRDPDRFFPPTYRRDYVRDYVLPKFPDPLKFSEPRGQRYFQIEPGVEYRIEVAWERGRLRFSVNGEKKWEVDLPDPGERPPRIRILTYAPGWIDDLRIGGVVDPSARERAVSERKKRPL